MMMVYIAFAELLRVALLIGMGAALVVSALYTFGFLMYTAVLGVINLVSSPMIVVWQKMVGSYNQNQSDYVEGSESLPSRY